MKKLNNNLQTRKNEKVDPLVASLMPDSDKKMGAIASASLFVALALCFWASAYEVLIDDQIFAKSDNEELRATMMIVERKDEKKEVKEKKVYVTAVCPAGIATDLYGLAKDWQKIGLRIGALSTPRFRARRGLNAMFRHQKCIVPDWWWRLFIPICLLIPEFLMKVIRKYTKKFQK